MNPKQKRITIPVSVDIDAIGKRLQQDSGITMTYSQIFNFLIHFYLKHAAEPRTQWKSGMAK